MQITSNKPKNLNHIDLYNLQVKKYLELNVLTPIQQHAIKIFKDNAFRNKLIDSDYNLEVESLNKSGLILRKKAIAYKNEAIDTGYTYINYPYLDREAVKTTMSNYRQYIATYNKKVKEDNKPISIYNLSVLTSKDAKIKKQIKAFKKEHNYLYTRDYNLKVEEYNADFTNKIYKKKPIQTIKFSSEIVFHTLLGFYVKQLKLRNQSLMQMNLSTSTDKNSLPRLKVNHRSLAIHKIEGIARLDICKKTVQNHVKRLREAGLLTNYVYINQNKPIQVNFNTKILTILDGKLPKRQESANQLITPPSLKVLHHKNETTNSILKEKKKKGNVSNIGSLITGSSLQSLKTKSPAVSYKNTTVKSTKKENQVAAKNLGYVEKISNNYRNRFQNTQLMAADLANGVYDAYKGLRYDYLKQVIQYGNLTNEEFAHILQQDVLKSSAKIWKNHSVFVGEWKKTINQITEIFFTSCQNKDQMLQKLIEYRWKLNFARKWFSKNERNALFPFQYFDKTRVKSGELGFFGLHSVWKTHLNYLLKRQKEEKAAKLTAAQRQRKLTNNKKLEKAINQYYSGKWSFNRLTNYVQDSLGNDYYLKLPSLIKNSSNFTA
jgi:DNA-binding Lrp family transcriptional regulator